MRGPSIPYLEKYRPRTVDEVVGNERAKKQVRNWLTRLGVPRNILLSGPNGTGKTSLARLLAGSISCDNREAQSPDPCGRLSCDCSQVLQAGIAFGRGLRVRNGADMRQADLADDFGELSYVQEHAVVFFYDEIHRAPANVRESLLTRVEAGDGNFHVIAATSDLKLLDWSFISRFSQVETTFPTEDQLVSLLKTICDRERFQVSGDELRAIAANERAPRPCIVALWDLASLSDYQ